MTELQAARRCHWVNHLARHAHEQPDAVAFRFGGQSVTWRELEARVGLLADAFARRGVGPGDRVLLLLTNRLEFVEAMFAANRLGAVAVPVNFRLSPAELTYIIGDSDPSIIVVEQLLAAAVNPAPVRCLVVGDDPAAAGPSAERWQDVLDEVGEPHPPVDVAENDPALIMYTSGTTGRPKGAVLTHLNLHMQAVTIICAWGSAGSTEISLAAAPLFHIAGIGTIVPMMLLGSTMVIHPSGLFSATDILDVLERERVTVLFLVPTQWQAICADPSVTSRDLALRVISWGAAPASDTLLRRMAEVFPDATNIAVFGQTEMSPVTCVLDGEDALRKLGSVGKPISTLAVRVVDAEMRDVPGGEVGEIIYRGPTTMQGYWRNPEATAAAFDGGWFHSGDLVRRDEEGFVYVVDRKKDMIISGGENIYCAEVENALAAHPGIAEVAVIGRPHERWGETPVAVLVPVDAETAPTVQELAQWLGGRLAGYKKPTEVIVLPELPHNASGKVVKHLLRTTYGG